MPDFNYQVENPMSERVARLYDVSTPDWPGEVGFYSRLLDELDPVTGSVLEIACGTGRITSRVAERGLHTVGIDVSQPMLDIAAEKSVHLSNAQYICTDMRSFDLGQQFDLIISPGHSFQHMLTTGDQVACLASVRRHMKPGATLVLHVDHQDMDWLGRVAAVDRDVPSEPSSVTDPATGNRVESTIAWAYSRVTQVATFTSVWRELSADGEVLDEWSRGPVPVHCIFPAEMEHLFARTGLGLVTVHGDFEGGPLTEDSEEMIWVVRRPC